MILGNDNYYKPIRVSNFYSSNYIEYKSNGDRDKNDQLKNISIKLDNV